MDNREELLIALQDSVQEQIRMLDPDDIYVLSQDSEGRTTYAIKVFGIYETEPGEGDSGY